MNEESYRRAAVEGASSVALVVMLYDRLVADMHRAISAMQHNEIEARCAELKHALLILQQLEGSLDHQRGGEAARNLAAFYSHARAKIVEAQLKSDTTMLDKLIAHFLDVKSAWQKVEARGDSLGFGAGQSAKQPGPPTGESLLSCSA